MNRRVVACTFLLVLAGCTTCPEPDTSGLLPGFGLATPDGALEYFQVAVEQDRPIHEYLVLSEALKQRFLEQQGERLTFDLYMRGRSRILDSLRRDIGPIESVEIGTPIQISPREARVPLRSGARSSSVDMILEVTCLVDAGDGEIAVLRPTDRDATLTTDRSGVKLSVGGPLGDVPAANVYRVIYERFWKIRDIGTITRDLAPVLPTPADAAPSPDPRRRAPERAIGTPSPREDQ